MRYSRHDNEKQNKNKRKRKSNKDTVYVEYG